MFSQLLPTIAFVLAGLAAFLGYALWRTWSERRSHAMLYEGHSKVPPPSSVCTRCRRRGYSRRAIEEQYCEHCDSHY